MIGCGMQEPLPFLDQLTGRVQPYTPVPRGLFGHWDGGWDYILCHRKTSHRIIWQRRLVRDVCAYIVRPLPTPVKPLLKICLLKKQRSGELLLLLLELGLPHELAWPITAYSCWLT